MYKGGGLIKIIASRVHITVLLKKLFHIIFITRVLLALKSVGTKHRLQVIGHCSTNTESILSFGKT